MNELGIRKVEAALGVSIPQEFRDVVSPADIGRISPHWLAESVAAMIALNEKLREDGLYGDPWHSHLLATGEGEDSEVYFVDLAENPLWMHVAYVDHEPFYSSDAYRPDCRQCPLARYGGG